jgi:hypothetical protein
MAQAGSLTISIWDYCDPSTFGQAHIGCQRSLESGFITLQGFNSELTSQKSVGAWRFSPGRLAAGDEGVPAITVVNVGGENHTFTRVKAFGGGFVAPLNALAGLPVPAPECAQVVNGQLVRQPFGPNNKLVPAGATLSVPGVEGDEAVRFQCCIHPWMRATVNADHGDRH